MSCTRLDPVHLLGDHQVARNRLPAYAEPTAAEEALLLRSRNVLVVLPSEPRSRGEELPHPIETTLPGAGRARLASRLEESLTSDNKGSKKAVRSR